MELRLVFLDSWKPSSHDGSGTAVGISTLARALRSGGAEVRILRPRWGAGSLPGRLLFNVGVPGRIAAVPSPHLVVGFDLDGLRWGCSIRRSGPYVVALKGVATDEARFARSSMERLFLRSAARLEGRNARCADRVLVPSRYSADVACRAYALPAERIRVVPEPIDMASWDALRSSSPPLPERPTILSVARQYPRKDTATLLRALPLVRAAVPDVHLRIVGGGPMLRTLTSLSSHLDLDDHVTFHGPVLEHEEVRRAFLEAHLFCLPSLQEGFGIAYLEAMAAGLPVVAARAGAVPELVIHEETGLLVPPGDDRQLARALVRLLTDPAARMQMGSAGARRARRYDLDPVARAFLEATGLSDPGRFGGPGPSPGPGARRRGVGAGRCDDGGRHDGGVIAHP